MIGKAKVLKKKRVETVTVNVGADDGNVSGYEVTITTSDGEVVATQTSSTGTYKIPFGQGYTIKASYVSGYNTPQEQTFVASESKRVVDVTYTKIVHSGTTEPTNGIWIQDTDGYFHTESEWDGTYTPNGIAVITDNCSFVVVLEEISTSMKIYNGYMTYPDLPQVSSESSAILDYDGVGNTAKMTAVYGTDSTYAAGACTNFTFPNGKTGYLGAAGEWQATIDNKAAINTALSKVGGTQLSTSGYHWSSTRASDNDYSNCCFWSCLFSSDFWLRRNIPANQRVRAFTSL